MTAAIVPITIDDLSIPVPTSKRGVSDFVLQQSSSGTFSDYHVAAVFRSYGLPDYTFGGAPLGGTTGGGFMEWFLGEWLWCSDCDRVP